MFPYNDTNKQVFLLKLIYGTHRNNLDRFHGVEYISKYYNYLRLSLY